MTIMNRGDNGGWGWPQHESARNRPSTSISHHKRQLRRLTTASHYANHQFNQNEQKPQTLLPQLEHLWSIIFKPSWFIIIRWWLDHIQRQVTTVDYRPWTTWDDHWPRLRFHATEQAYTVHLDPQGPHHTVLKARKVEPRRLIRWVAKEPGHATNQRLGIVLPYQLLRALVGFGCAAVARFSGQSLAILGVTRWQTDRAHVESTVDQSWCLVGTQTSCYPTWL